MDVVSACRKFPRRSAALSALIVIDSTKGLPIIETSFMEAENISMNIITARRSENCPFRCACFRSPASATILC